MLWNNRIKGLALLDGSRWIVSATALSEPTSTGRRRALEGNFSVSETLQLPSSWGITGAECTHYRKRQRSAAKWLLLHHTLDSYTKNPARAPPRLAACWRHPACEEGLIYTADMYKVQHVIKVIGRKITEPNAMLSLGNGFLIFAPHTRINTFSSPLTQVNLASFGYIFH